MTAKSIPKLLTLKQAAELLGGNIPASTLRAEVLAGRLRCVRARPGCNAPILVTEAAILQWLDEHAGNRQIALSPREASAVNRNAENSCAGLHNQAADRQVVVDRVKSDTARAAVDTSAVSKAAPPRRA